MRPSARLAVFASVLLICALAVHVTVAASATVAPPVPGTPGYLQALLDALRAKNWHLLVALALIGVVAVIRWISPKIHGRIGAWLNTQRGGTVLVLTCGIIGAIGTALYGGAKINVNLIVSGITVGVLASGGWNVVWDLVSPTKKVFSEHSSPTIPIQKVS